MSLAIATLSKATVVKDLLIILWGGDMCSIYFSPKVMCFYLQKDFPSNFCFLTEDGSFVTVKIHLLI